MKIDWNIDTKNCFLCNENCDDNFHGTVSYSANDKSAFYFYWPKLLKDLEGWITLSLQWINQLLSSE